ncbi:hypothetical protein NDU88_010015 [Pleurodeles waltl]|uniref:Uncharacterized protein n=1 Tax=Pleurodeles waltl TaxID=8319 RepID=A0AAV7QX09_PLEWA|nr:hypothetical protein NDU88_010015 [Pleurodeles waltl]
MLCSGPRLGYGSGHYELPVVAGLRPNYFYRLGLCGYISDNDVRWPDAMRFPVSLCCVTHAPPAFRRAK